MILSRVSSPRHRMLLAVPGHLCIAATLLLGACTPILAQGTHLWTQSRFDEFEHGMPQGVEITSDGKLRAGPTATDLLTTPSSFVWAVAVGKDGVAYLGTGSPTTVLRVDLAAAATANYKPVTLFESKALAVQALRLGPDGMIYAATVPDGKVFRIKPDATKPLDELAADQVFDLNTADTAKPDGKADIKTRYIWDMTFDSAGRLYIATGAPGAIYRIDPKQPAAQPEVFFKSDEAHLRTLAWDKAGNLLAGSDGSGLVYRISPQGKGYVLYSAPRREITALAVGADGTIFAADVGDRNRNPLPPLPVQNGAGITITFSQPGSVQAANASTTLPEGTEIYALTPNAAPRKLWTGKDEIVYSLSSSEEGLLALTGNRGRVLRIFPDGSSADLAHLDAQQVVSIAPISGGWLLGTANSGKLYALTQHGSADIPTNPPGGKHIEDHSYASDVLDAGALSRWGRAEVDPDSHGYQISTRSGNVEQPARSARDWGWSEWQPVVDGKIGSPAGRYMQWKVTLAADGVVSGVGVNYLPVNSAPVVDDVVVVPGARVTPQLAQAAQTATVSIAFPAPAQSAGVSFDAGPTGAAAPLQAQKDRTAVTLRWAAHDDNGDDLVFDLYIRGDGEQIWRPLKRGITDKFYSFDAAAIPDGGYSIKVVASDSPSHTPNDALSGELVSERFELDTTPPEITALKAAAPTACKPAPCSRDVVIPISFDAHDASSPITHAEYSIDAGPWLYVEPVGGLSDSREEHYAVSIPLPDGPDANPTGEHLITVRVYDRHENVAAAKVIVPAQTKAR